METLYTEWLLKCYKEILSQEEKSRFLDESEKFALGKPADNVRVGVKSNRVEIIIKKTF